MDASVVAESRKESVMVRDKRGFTSRSETDRRKVANKTTVADQNGTAHELTSEEALDAERQSGTTRNRRSGQAAEGVRAEHGHEE